MAVTIRQVAEQAQVSVSTVSRVFNQRDLVKEATRTHVETIAKALGYVPNATARSLSSGQTSAIGVILPLPHGEFFSEIIRGLDEEAQKSGYHLLISSSHNRPEETETALQMMAGRVDGLVIISPHLDAQRYLEQVHIDCPAVFVSSAVEGEAYDTVITDNFEGARKATRHLIERGHRRIAVIKGPHANFEVQERLRGFRAAMCEAGLEVDIELAFEGEFVQESGYEAGRRIAALDDMPTAVFAFNDYMAIGALRAFHEAGLSVPNDVAVVGFDDIGSSRFSNPPLTSVHIPVHDIGREAVAHLIDAISEGDRHQSCRHVLPTRLVVRASSDLS